MINPPRERRIVFRAYLDTVEYVYADISIIGRGTGALTGIVSHLLYTARLYAALISSLPAERRLVSQVSRAIDRGETRTFPRESCARLELSFAASFDGEQRIREMGRDKHGRERGISGRNALSRPDPSEQV